MLMRACCAGTCVVATPHSNPKAPAYDHPCNSRHSSIHHATPSAAAVQFRPGARQRNPPRTALYAAPPQAQGSSPPTPHLSPTQGTLHASMSSSPAAGTSEPGQQQSCQDPPGDVALVTFSEIQEVARLRGLCITLSTLGPFYRIVCRQPPASSPAAPCSPPAPGSMHGSSSVAGDDGAQGRVMAVATGFVAPFLQLLHIDTLQVMTKGLRGEEGQRIRGSLGLGLLLGGAIFSHGLACGCAKAEILAINDEDAWHERLVRYYRFFGFVPVREVGGNGWSDLPHLLVWGGEGTRMDADVRQMLRKWTPALKRSLREAQG